MNDNKFKLWKLALSAIHIDGEVSPEEETWFLNQVDQLEKNKILNFSSEQMSELRDCLRAPVADFLAEFNALTNPADCSQVLHLIREVAFMDKEFCHKEKAIYKELEKACLKGVDLKEIEKNASTIENESYREENIYDIKNKHSLFEMTFKRILRLLNPGDYKFPKEH